MKTNIYDEGQVHVPAHADGRRRDGTDASCPATLGRIYHAGAGVLRTNGTTALEVRVTDPHIADARLLPLLLEGGQKTVITFGRKQHNLEGV